MLNNAHNRSRPASVAVRWQPSSCRRCCGFHPSSAAGVRIPSIRSSQTPTCLVSSVSSLPPISVQSPRCLTSLCGNKTGSDNDDTGSKVGGVVRKEETGRRPKRRARKRRPRRMRSMLRALTAATAAFAVLSTGIKTGIDGESQHINLSLRPAAARAYSHYSGTDTLNMGLDGESCYGLNEDDAAILGWPITMERKKSEADNSEIATISSSDGHHTHDKSTSVPSKGKHMQTAIASASVAAGLGTRHILKKGGKTMVLKPRVPHQHHFGRAGIGAALIGGGQFLVMKSESDSNKSRRAAGNEKGNVEGEMKYRAIMGEEVDVTSGENDMKIAATPVTEAEATYNIQLLVERRKYAIQIAEEKRAEAIAAAESLARGKGDEKLQAIFQRMADRAERNAANAAANAKEVVTEARHAELVWIFRKLKARTAAEAQDEVRTTLGDKKKGAGDGFIGNMRDYMAQKRIKREKRRDDIGKIKLKAGRAKKLTNEIVASTTNGGRGTKKLERVPIQGSTHRPAERTSTAKKSTTSKVVPPSSYLDGVAKETIARLWEAEKKSKESDDE